jgi:predicted enzyme related to lactoylglutathione lyase
MINLVVYPVKDVTKATAFYKTLLGTDPYVSSPYYVGFREGNQEIGLDPNGHKAGLTGPIAYRQVDDIRKSLSALTAAGAQTQQDVKDVGGGLLIAWVKDADGNLTGLRQNAK